MLVFRVDTQFTGDFYIERFKVVAIPWLELYLNQLF